MKTKNIFIPIILLFSIASLFSCGESSKEKEQRQLIDSLQAVNAQGQMEYADLQDYLTVIAEGLDSIAIEEKELLANNTPGENKNFNRKRMQQNLSHVREILARHRDRIDELEKRLNMSQGDAQKLKTIITALREQLDAKDRELAQLKSDLEDNRKSLAVLTSRLKKMNEEQREQSQTIEDQQQTIAQQVEKMHTAYIKIASKKELKKEGLLTGGFLKKSKVDFSKVDASIFQEIDTRTFHSIAIPAGSKILTAVPSSSYRITNGANGSTLEILDTEKFWSVSKYLIIQTN